jgi:hypothetical protein
MPGARWRTAASVAEPPRAGVYAATVLRFGAAEETWIDLRRPVGPAGRSLLAGLGLDGSFGVLTACNPRGRLAPEPENRAANRALAERLRRLGRVVAVEGGSPDGSHREPGFAAPIPGALACEIAAEFGQDAIFWFDGARFWLVGALAPLGRIPLP